MLKINYLIIKSNKLFLFIVLLLILKNQFVFSQCISIESSVNWETGFDIFKEDSVICVPKLNITYRNNSNISYYFLNVSSNKAGLPLTIYSINIQYPVEEYIHPDYLKRAKLSLNSIPYGNYHVKIGGNPDYINAWTVLDDSSNNHKEELNLSMANDKLTDIYEYMHQKHSINSTDSIKEYKGFFSTADISPANILNTVKDRFVFLKPGECYIDTYNLIAFKLVGGSFTFCIDKNSLKDYVCTEPIWDKKQSKYVDVHVALPPEVGEYELYSGDFNTNEIIIQFKR